MNKKIIVFFILFFPGLRSFACELCEKNQPKLLKGITHGAGPTGTMDYIIIGIASVIVFVALFLSIKYLVKPREGNADHIKNIVLDEN